MVTDTAINDYITRIFIRYFRDATRAHVVEPVLNPMDRELLSLYWVLSDPVGVLLDNFARHHHEIRPSLQPKHILGNGRILGRLDAVASEIEQRRTGNLSNVVCITPSRSYQSRENLLLAWTIDRAWRACQALRTIAGAASVQGHLVDERLEKIQRYRRTETLKSIEVQNNVARQRPSLSDIVAVNRSRVGIYRLAAEAAHLLMRVEEADPRALQDIATQVVVGPEPTWKRYELAVLLALATALSQALEQKLTLGFLLPGEGGPVATVGEYEFYWQIRTDAYRTPPPELSEVLVRSIASYFGLGASVDRPDIVVYSSRTQTVVALAEVKWFSNDENARSILFEAIQQVVRYARGYRFADDVSLMLGTCIIALASSRDITIPLSQQPGIPFLLDAEGVLAGKASAWATYVVSTYETELATVL